MIQRTLQTSRLTLVPLGDEHLEYEVTLDANPDVMRYLGAGEPRDRSEVEKHHQERIEAARNGLGFWAGFLGSEFVGWWLLTPEDDDERGQAELGYRLLPDFWRQGLASEGAAALLAYGFEDVGLTQIFAETMAVNAGSRAVMSRLGLTYLATRGEGTIGPIPGSDQGSVDYAITKDRWATIAHYRFSADVAEIDRDQVHRWISEQSYWAPGRSRSRQDAAIDGSLNFGVYDKESTRQVAYARVITDGVTFAWLCDVFVDPEVRGCGIGGVLIAGVIEACEPLGLRRIALTTNDAHGLYSKLGFIALDLPETWMERIGNPSV